jgi:hypothetical protein
VYHALVIHASYVGMIAWNTVLTYLESASTASPSALRMYYLARRRQPLIALAHNKAACALLFAKLQCYNAFTSPTTMASLLPVAVPGGGLGADVAIGIYSCCVVALALRAEAGRVPVVFAHSTHVKSYR